MSRAGPRTLRSTALPGVLVVGTLLLAACGQKGPLYLPDPAPKAIAPLPPTSTATPAEPGSDADSKKKPPTTTPG